MTYSEQSRHLYKRLRNTIKEYEFSVNDDDCQRLVLLSLQNGWANSPEYRQALLLCVFFSVFYSMQFYYMLFYTIFCVIYFRAWATRLPHSNLYYLTSSEYHLLKKLSGCWYSYVPVTLKSNKVELFLLGWHENKSDDFEMLSPTMLENYQKLRNLTSFEAATMKLLITMAPFFKDQYEKAMLKHSRFVKIHKSLQSALNCHMPQFGLEMTTLMIYAQAAKDKSEVKIKDYGNRVYHASYEKVCSHEAESGDCDFHSWLIYQ